ncbi:hypothetical protein B0H10DRAFT_691173 [Mycena sp. CBHHK59/15]|nr:hypothetical protein B0H10DRAFT_691173 [Mycena sp. CBHHK59/15]
MFGGHFLSRLVTWKISLFFCSLTTVNVRFGRKTSNYRPSHSSGVMSFCIQNLETSLRYRVENLILSGMTPGPTEPTAEQLQNYLKIIVDDLDKF